MALGCILSRLRGIMCHHRALLTRLTGNSHVIILLPLIFLIKKLSLKDKEWLALGHTAGRDRAGM